MLTLTPAIFPRPVNLHDDQEWSLIEQKNPKESLKVYRRNTDRHGCTATPVFLHLLPNGSHYHQYHSNQKPQLFGNCCVILQQERDSQKAADTMVSEEYAHLNNERFEDLYEEQESALLLTMDPTKWKEQDHYDVLGLGKMRWRASDEDVKRAYRKKVLKHHPDKKEKRTRGDDNFFKCIQKAYELLSDPVKRKQWDSIDPQFDDSVPKSADGTNFFDIFDSIFARNAHFSKKHPVPSLGNINSTRSEVENFYQFWTSFDSWRSFEMLDEEQKEETENRDERRWIEKQNKAERTRRKKEEVARVIRLVDAAIKFDPRLQRFKEQDKQAKEAKKLAREEALKRAEEEAKQAAEDARLAKERKQAEEREAKEQEKKLKEQMKRLVKSFRKAIRSAISEQHKNFDGNPIEISKLTDTLLTFIGDNTDHLDNLSKSLLKESAECAKEIFDAELEKMNEAQYAQKSAEEKAKIEAQKAEDLKKKQQKDEENIPWPDDELKLLVKAVNMFPGGTVRRWETIAEYLAQHSSNNVLRKPDEIIQMSNQVRKGKMPINTSFQKTKKKEVIIADAPTARSDEISEPANDAPMIESQAPSRPWDANEQALLEKSLRAYPSSGPNAYTGADRWDKIAAMVPGRSKKEVVSRIKELMKAIKAKKTG